MLYQSHPCDMMTAILILISCVALVVSGITLIFAMRMRRDAGRHNNTLREQTAVEADRRALTVEFLRLHAATLEKFDSTLSNIRRKLVAGQVASVKDMLESQVLNDDHDEMQNLTFDNTIFNLYPDFLQQVNALLIPERRIETAEGRLTTELRVLAFSCLGIDDTAVVARFLRLSHNTVYTYRNRMRQRALDRDTFDRSIQQIGLSA